MNRRTAYARPLLCVLALTAVLTPGPAAARESGDPIELAWTEGDVAGTSEILSPDGRSIIGFVDYHQRRRGALLSVIRIARFADGSSDEDRVEARIGKTLETLRGRSIIRNAKGISTVDIKIDVER